MRKLLTSSRLLLTAVVSVLAVSVSHVAAVNASSMAGMSMEGHGTQSSVQCQTLCMTALPGAKQDELIQIKNDNKEPEPYYVGTLAMGILGALFIAKRSSSFATNWRPPDLVLLHGHYADGL